MKPPVHSSSPAAGSDMADSEQPLLQAARDLSRAESSPALDAAILSAAAQHAAEIRRARAITTEVPVANPGAAKNLPPLARFSRWLFGDGEGRGHFRQALAASIVAGIALGIVWQAERENAPVMSDVAMMESATVLAAPALEPEPGAITQTEAVEEMPAEKAMPPAEEKPVAASADSTVVETTVDKLRLAAAPPPPKEALAEYRADHSRAAPKAARRAAPSPMREAAKPMQDAAKAQEMDVGAEIDAQLKRILELRRAGKEEEAQDLLRQLRARYPANNIDERLRQREKEEAAKPYFVEPP